MARAAIWRGVLVVCGHVAVGAAIGLALAAAYWAAAMVLGGHSIAEAARGQVEDGLGLLQGLAALGILCGGGVGLCFGPRALGKGRA